MGFTQAISSGFQNYVNFSGRACRSEYWFWTLFVVLVTIVANILDSFATFGAASLITGLGLLLPGLAISVRRLHDIDRTGWWLLLILTGIGAIVLLIFACLPGTEGPNSYGADPLAGQHE
jgi:uncharacterized membrane protein YhaH (DUF805 family)